MCGIFQFFVLQLFEQQVLQVCENQPCVLQPNSYTNDPELMSDSTGLRAQSHKIVLTSEASCKSQVANCTFDQQAIYKLGVPMTLLSGVIIC